jgi:amino acid permease
MVGELKFPNKSKFSSKVTKMIRISMMGSVFATVLYYVVGSFAYFAFGDTIASNLLTNFQQKGYWYLGIVKFAYGLVVLFSNPVVVYCAITTIDGWIFTGERTLLRRFCESFLWCTCIWLLAIMIPQLDVVFGLTGATSGILLVFVLPSYFYLAVAKRMQKRTNNSAISMIGPSWFVPLAKVLIVFTLILGVIATVSQISELVA